MKKAEQIVAAIFTIVNYPKDSYHAYELCIEKVDEIINKKCEHPITSISASGTKKSNWRCMDCGSEVIAVKYEAVE